MTAPDPAAPCLLRYAKAHPLHPDYAIYLRGQRRQRVTPRVRPQLGYEPRSYDQIYTKAYTSSRSFARLRQRQRGKWAMVVKQTQEVMSRCQAAPYGMAHARQRAFTALDRATPHHEHFSYSEYSRQQVRDVVGLLRRERLAIVGELAYAQAHGLPPIAHYS